MNKTILGITISVSILLLMNPLPIFAESGNIILDSIQAQENWFVSVVFHLMLVVFGISAILFRKKI